MVVVLTFFKKNKSEQSLLVLEIIFLPSFAWRLEDFD